MNKPEKPEKGKALDTILGVMGLEAVYEDVPDKPEKEKEKPTKTKHSFSSSNSSSQTSASSSSSKRWEENTREKSQIIVIEPTKRSDAQRVTDCLKQGKTVVVNVEKMTDKDDIVRLWDFIVGASYALEGKTEILNEKVIITVPKTVDIRNIESVHHTESDDEEEEYEI